MTTAEEATAGSSSEAELKKVILATATGASVGTLTGLKVTADEDASPTLIEVSKGAMTEDRVGGLIGVLSPESADIWTTADVEVVLSTTLMRLLDISARSAPRDCERVLGIETTELVIAAASLSPIV